MKRFKQNVEIIRHGQNYFLTWTIKNIVAKPVGINAGILLYNSRIPYVHTLFKPLAFTDKLWIDSGREVEILHDQLVKDKVDNWRFYFHAYESAGIETTTSQAELLTESDFNRVKKEMDKLAKLFELPDEIDPGLFIELDERDKQIKAIMEGQPANNGQPQIISITMEEGFHEDTNRDETDIQVVDLRSKR